MGECEIPIHWHMNKAIETLKYNQMGADIINHIHIKKPSSAHMMCVLKSRNGATGEMEKERVTPLEILGIKECLCAPVRESIVVVRFT
jgi:hypothetical protein